MVTKWSLKARPAADEPVRVVVVDDQELSGVD